MWVFYTLVVLGSLAAIANLVLLFFLALFLVKMRDRHDQFFSDVVMMISGFEVPEVPVIVQQEDKKPKTWDEKYEEELAAQERRMRGDSGLSDLPPPKATFGEAPAANAQAQEGLIFKDVKSNMRR